MITDPSMVLGSGDASTEATTTQRSAFDEPCARRKTTRW